MVGGYGAVAWDTRTPPLQLKDKGVLKAQCGGLRAGRPTEQ